MMRFRSLAKVLMSAVTSSVIIAANASYADEDECGIYDVISEEAGQAVEMVKVTGSRLARSQIDDDARSEFLRFEEEVILSIDRLLGDDRDHTREFVVLGVAAFSDHFLAPYHADMARKLLLLSSSAKHAQTQSLGAGDGAAYGVINAYQSQSKRPRSLKGIITEDGFELA